MDFKIIDARAHLLLPQKAEISGQQMQTLRDGDSPFGEETCRTMSSVADDGKNAAEILFADMDYAGVSAAIITQEHRHGLQNAYLCDVQNRYPDRLLCCGSFDIRLTGYLNHVRKLLAHGFQVLKIISDGVSLISDETMQVFNLMQDRDILLSIDMTSASDQARELEEIIVEYPSLRIAISYSGKAMCKDWKQQIKLARYTNVRIETGRIMSYYNDELYPSAKFLRTIMEAADVIGIHKLMWGSDYPRTIAPVTYRMSYDFILKSTLLNDKEKCLFLGKNAEAFYRLNSVVNFAVCNKL